MFLEVVFALFFMLTNPAFVDAIMLLLNPFGFGSSTTLLVLGELPLVFESLQAIFTFFKSNIIDSWQRIYNAYDPV